MFLLASGTVAASVATSPPNIQNRHYHDLSAKAPNITLVATSSPNLQYRHYLTIICHHHHFNASMCDYHSTSHIHDQQ
jgi:hypothetical protein